MTADDLQVSRLPETPSVSADLLRRLRGDYERLAEQGPPADVHALVSERYGLDLTAQYAGYALENPWGKASGQLSMTARQVQEDVDAGLGFVVLKTVIAEDESGGQGMRDWAIKESRMVAEPIIGRSGTPGWTVSWKGRGWWESFDEYLRLVRDARSIAAGTSTLIVPSCKYHLPAPGEDDWKWGEYVYTTGKIVSAWRDAAGSPGDAVPLEQDFSPTLAGSDRAAAQPGILEWLRTVPELVAKAAETAGTARPPAVSQTEGDETRATARQPSAAAVRLGLKMFNALFDDDFQLDMLRTIHEPGPGRPSFFVYANRLFDPHRTFEGHTGIAYGGPDLSDRNLRIMRRFQQLCLCGDIARPLLSWSATGNVTTGKLALEYALLGAESFQLHTYFQLPADQFRMKSGSKTDKVLHELYFHPHNGFIVWMHHLAGALHLDRGPIRFHDVVGRGPELTGA